MIPFVPSLCLQDWGPGLGSRTFHLSCNRGNEAATLGLFSNVNSHTSHAASSQDIEAQRSEGDHEI